MFDYITLLVFQALLLSPQLWKEVNKYQSGKDVTQINFKACCTRQTEYTQAKHVAGGVFTYYSLAISLLTLLLRSRLEAF